MYTNYESRKLYFFLPLGHHLNKNILHYDATRSGSSTLKDKKRKTDKERNKLSLLFWNTGLEHFHHCIPRVFYQFFKPGLCPGMANTQFHP